MSPKQTDEQGLTASCAPVAGSPTRGWICSTESRVVGKDHETGLGPTPDSVLCDLARCSLASVSPSVHAGHDLGWPASHGSKVFSQEALSPLHPLPSARWCPNTGRWGGALPRAFHPHLPCMAEQSGCVSALSPGRCTKPCCGSYGMSAVG